MILTRYGTCQIMSLPYTGEVLTSCGWKQYINPRVTRKNASLVEVRFANGYSVKCTPDHSFKTVNGWKSAESLLPNMLIQSALTPSRSISMAVYTVCGLVKNIYHGVARSCTEMLGILHLELSQMVATSTIETATPKTIALQTLSAYPQKSIYQKHGIASLNENLRSQLETGLPLGINQVKVGFGTADTPNDKNHGKSGKEKKCPASIAVFCSMLWSGSLYLKSIAQPLAKLLRTVCEVLTKPQPLVIESVKKLNNQSDVWCLTVPHAEEFALKNGAIVHNCSHPADAMRMLAVSWRIEPRVKAPDTMKPLIVGPENTATLNDMWATHKTNRSQRL